MGNNKSKNDSNSDQAITNNLSNGVVVKRLTKHFVRQSFKNSNSSTFQTFPEPIIGIIYNYYHLKFIWDIKSNKDNTLTISEDQCKFTSKADKKIYHVHTVYSSIFMNEWITENDCKYYFRFKLYGQPSFDNAFAIGIVNEKYNMSHAEGIGYDENGWSFYVWGKTKSACFYRTNVDNPHPMIPVEVNDGSEIELTITIKDGKCSSEIKVDDQDTEPVPWTDFTPPLMIGASIHTKDIPLALEIIDYNDNY